MRWLEKTNLSIFNIVLLQFLHESDSIQFKIFAVLKVVWKLHLIHTHNTFFFFLVKLEDKSDLGSLMHEDVLKSNDE